MPVIGGIVFDGVLEVLEHQVCVADLENITRWIRRLGKSGPQRVVICADVLHKRHYVVVGRRVRGTFVPPSSPIVRTSFPMYIRLYATKRG